MKIAVSSQNRKTVTGHAGKCRRFWIYDIDSCEVMDRRLVELALEETFHEGHGVGPHPLGEVNVLITGGMGDGLQRRLKQMGILAVATAETDLERAVADWLNGTLKELPPGQHHHDHQH
jgi:predicted Fe-Mo cluster-binding NifX family protein